MVQSVCRERVKLDDLLQLCLKTRDEYHWNEFVRRSQPVIARAVISSMRRSTGKVAWALLDDLVQDTYVKLCTNGYRALREFKCAHDNAVCGFLKVIAANVVRDYFRTSLSQKRGAGTDHVPLETVSITGTEISHTRTHLERQLLMYQIRRSFADRTIDLNFRRDSAIFWLYYRYGLSSKAIAQIGCIGLTVKGVESTLVRLTRHVKKQLSPKHPRFREIAFKQEGLGRRESPSKPLVG